MTSATARLGARRRPVAYTIVIVDAVVAALLFGLWLGGGWPANQLVALASAGPFTAWSLPVVRLAVQVCAVGTVGMLITGVLLPRTEGELGETGLRCLRTAAWLTLAWGVATAAMLALTWSEVTALPVTKLPLSQLFSAAGGASGSFPEAIPYLFGVLLSLLISAGAAAARTTHGAAGLLVLSGYNLLPLTTQGHSSHNALTPYAVTVHVVALSLWAGGLAALLIHVRARPDLLSVVVPRFSNLAVGCYVAVGVSGFAAALAIVESPSDLWSSRYGLLVLCKVAALTALGVLGWRHRRRTVPALSGDRARRAFLRLAATEVVIMAATVALGVALSETPTPGTTSVDQHLHAAPYGGVLSRWGR
jgi:putative copper export protein